MKWIDLVFPFVSDNFFLYSFVPQTSLFSYSNLNMLTEFEPGSSKCSSDVIQCCTHFVCLFPYSVTSLKLSVPGTLGCFYSFEFVNNCHFEKDAWSLELVHWLNLTVEQIHENAEGPIRKYPAWFILDESAIDHVHILKQLLMESMMSKSFQLWWTSASSRHLTLNHEILCCYSTSEKIIKLFEAFTAWAWEYYLH